MKMQAALWYGPEDLRIESINVPRVGPGEVLVKIDTALTCGTDFKLFRRGHAFLAKTVPAPFGHEMAGTIVEVGPGGDSQEGFRVGDRVVAANSAPCGDCFFCRKGQDNLCEDLEFLTGAYAEYIRIPRRIVQKNLYHIPDGVSFRQAALTEPLSCALHCFEKTNLRGEDTLTVIGAGPCGLLFVQLAKRIGARVICLARGEEKLAVAKSIGADHTVSVHQEGYQERIRDLTEGGRGADVVIEAAGQPATWELATRLVRKGGQVWFYGGCARGTQVTLDTHRIHYEEISLSGVFHHTPHYFRSALSLIAEKKVSVEPLICGNTKLSNLTSFFRRGATENPLKIAVTP